MRRLPTRRRVCSVCARGEAVMAKLARARAEGLSHLSLARRFELSESAVWRHLRNRHDAKRFTYAALEEWERLHRP